MSMLKNTLTAALAALALPLAAATRADAETLHVGYANIGAFEPYFIAQRMGWFEEAGLDVELIDSSNPQQSIARLMSGELDVVGGSSAPTIAAIAQGVPIRIIYSNQSIGEQPTVGLVVRADSPYQSIADLAGQRIGTLGLQGTGSFLVFRAFREAGMPFDSAELINMPPQTFIENLQNGNVEAIVPFALFYDLALANPQFRLIPEPYEAMVGTAGIVTLATEATLAARGDEIARLIEVMDRAYSYANEHPDEVRAIDREMTQLPPAYIDNRPIPPSSVRLDTDRLQALADDMVAFGFIPAAPSVDRMLWDRMPH